MSSIIDEFASRPVVEILDDLVTVPALGDDVSVTHEGDLVWFGFVSLSAVAAFVRLTVA